MFLQCGSLTLTLHFERGCLQVRVTLVCSLYSFCWNYQHRYLIWLAAVCQITGTHFSISEQGLCPVKHCRAFFERRVPLGVAVGLLVCSRGHLLFSSPSRAWGHRRTVFPFIRQMCKTPAYSSERLLYSSTAGNVTSFLVIKPTLFCKSLSWLMQFLYKTLTPKSKR